MVALDLFSLVALIIYKRSLSTERAVLVKLMEAFSAGRSG